MWTFNNILKTTIWGGTHISQYKDITTDRRNIGESWEISGVPGSLSVVAEGPDKGLTLPELIERHGAALTGRKNLERFGCRFPLLIKFIDAAANLSVQVHPDDALARKRGYPCGKTEMWYVIKAAPGAKLANGFLTPVAPKDYQRLVATGDIEHTLRFRIIKPGEVYFIPAGRVHAIGSGAFVAEIQQTSDVTYRLFDYHRKDAEGHERQLHTAEAFDAINFDDTDGRAVSYTPWKNRETTVVDTPFFTTDVIECDSPISIDTRSRDSFTILIAIEGEAEIECDTSDEGHPSGSSEGQCRQPDETALMKSMTLRRGHTVLLAAATSFIDIRPRGTFRALATYIRP